MGYLKLKRGLDFASSLLLLPVAIPMIAVTALVLLAVQGRPIFFVQLRPGFRGRPFKIVKFRTMTIERRHSGPEAEEEVVTPIGKLFRASSLDELPQLLNILRGEMSFIGPRPLLVEYLSLYTPEQNRRHDVRPGLTGLAQVEGRNLVPWDKRLELDVFYSKHVSLRMDCKILIKSVGIALSQKGVSSTTSEIMPKFAGSES